MQVLGILIIDDYGDYLYIPTNTAQPRKSEVAKRPTSVELEPSGIVSPPSPLEERADKETVLDLSLGGLLKKNTQKEE